MASALEPDAVASEDIADVNWPAQGEAKTPPPAKTQALAPRKHKFAGRSERRKERIADRDEARRIADKIAKVHSGIYLVAGDGQIALACVTFSRNLRCSNVSLNFGLAAKGFKT